MEEDGINIKNFDEAIGNRGRGKFPLCEINF